MTSYEKMREWIQGEEENEKEEEEKESEELNLTEHPFFDKFQLVFF